MTQEEAVMRTAEVTREHRILAVKAHTGFLDWDHRSLSKWAPAFVDGTTENNALQQIAQAIADAEARGEARNAAELLKHQDLVEALQWLPVGTVVNFCDLDDFLAELRGKPLTPGAPGRWLPIRECKHRHRGDLARCVDCRNEDE